MEVGELKDALVEDGKTNVKRNPYQCPTKYDDENGGLGDRFIVKRLNRYRISKMTLQAIKRARTKKEHCC